MSNASFKGSAIFYTSAIAVTSAPANLFANSSGARIREIINMSTVGAFIFISPSSTGSTGFGHAIAPLAAFRLSQPFMGGTVWGWAAAGVTVNASIFSC